MSYRLIFTKDASKDYERVKQSQVKTRVRRLLEILENNPIQNPPPFERLKGNLEGFYSRRINDQHRLVYYIKDNEVIIKAMWSHYEDN